MSSVTIPKNWKWCPEEAGCIHCKFYRSELGGHTKQQSNSKE